MRIFITGATGFVGSYILRRLLREGYEKIVAIKRKNSKMDLIDDIAHQLKWVECDLFDIPQLDDLIKESDAVIHVAGMISMSHRNKKTVFKTNVEGTENLINISLSQKIKRFIHISSVAAFGKSNKMIDESAIWKGHKSKSIYGLSKYLGEREAWRGFAEGLNLSIINPSFVLGGTYWDVGPLNMIRLIDNGLKFYPTGTNGVVDVRDVANICNQLLNKNDVSGKSFICNAQNISHFNLIKMICRRLNKKYPTIALKGLLGEIAWISASIKSTLSGSDSLFTREAFDISSHNYEYDNSRSLELLKYDYIPLDQTLDDTLECYIESKKNNMTFGVLK